MAKTPASSVTNNARSAVAYLQSQGWTKEQAAGLVGNFQAESGKNLNPADVGDNGTAYGIAQWHPDRQAKFQQLYGKPIQGSSVQEQLAFANWELRNTEKAAGNQIKATNNAADAARATDKYYERSSGVAIQQRVQNANALVDAPGAAPALSGLTPQEKNRITTPRQPGETNVDANGNPINPNQEYITDPITGTKYLATPGQANNLTPFNTVPDNLDFTQPLANVLHDYPSYTYGLSLHLLTATEYNSIVSGSAYKPKRVLVASAGRYNNTGAGQFIRSPYFSEDFYFNELTTTTVIGTNQYSRNTNAIEFNFTLLEPYGMTLINRLLDQANDPEMQCDNYLDMVYLLQIDFFASNDSGETVGIVSGSTKTFPIKITQMNIKAGVNGSEYQISAVPYNHVAYDQTTGSVPANFEVSGGSVGEILQSGGKSNTSFSGAMNNWNNSLVKNNKVSVPDTYSFDVHPSIANSTMTSVGSISARDTVMPGTNNANDVRLSNIGKATKAFNPSNRNFSITAGTSVDKVIDYAVRNSSYIQNQLAIPDGVDPATYLQQKAKNANQPLNWYKIVPSVKLGEFDPIRKVYAKNITYSVQPYTIYNVKSDVAPQGKITNFVKQYNFIYTGENKDILEFDINFNTLFYTAQTAYRSALSDIYKSTSASDESKKSKNSESYQGATQKTNSVMPMMIKPQVFNAKSRATGGVVTAKNVAVADLEDSLMTLSSADMLNVQLKIVGDPQFIKQDDCFYSPLNNMSTSDPRLTPNNSLRTDYGEIYVLLTFRTPTDINENTGMMTFADNYRTSAFSGIYKVLTVQSEFRTGQFVQTLNLIRLPYQSTYDYATTQKTTTQRNTDISNATVPQLTNSNPVSVTGNGLSKQLPIAPDAIKLAANPAEVLAKINPKLKNINVSGVTQIMNQTNQPIKNVPANILRGLG